VRESHSSNTARGWFAGVRHFCRWLESEGETDRDATAGIRTPAPGDPETAVLSDEDLRALLATCAGSDFTARRDAAIVLLFWTVDCGCRSWPASRSPTSICGTGWCTWSARRAGVAVLGIGQFRSG